MINNALVFKEFSEALKEKRGKNSLRDAAQEIGISSSTLSRIENGSVPDLETYFECCKWLRVDMNKYLPKYEVNCQNQFPRIDTRSYSDASTFKENGILALIVYSCLTTMFLIWHYCFTKH